MKLGLLTAIFADMPFEEVVDYAAATGLECLEVACWPTGKAERRYAGVSHIDVERVLRDEEYTEHILNLCAEKNVPISAMSYYANPMQADADRGRACIRHLENVIKAAHRLGVGVVGTFVGRDQNKSVRENIELFKRIWPGIIELAEQYGIKLAIENCPMLFTDNEWPGGQNIAASPAIWRELFSICDSASFGLNFDPSHFVWQQMDYIKALYEFRDKIFHVHYKDIALSKERVDEYGIMATPLSYMTPRIPGHGDVDWAKFISALYDLRLNVPGCIEIEDKAFEASTEDIKKSIEISYKYLRNFII